MSLNRLAAAFWIALVSAVGLLFASALVPAQAFPLSSPVPGANPPFPLTFTALSSPKAMAVADFDNDGRDDVAAAGGSYLGRILALPGGYAPPVQVGSFTCLDTKIQFAADVTNDGNIDLVVSTYCAFGSGGANSTYLCPGDGAGQFGPPIPVVDPSGFPASYHSCFAASSLAPLNGGAFVFCAKDFYYPAVIKVYVMTVQGTSITPSQGITITCPATVDFEFTSLGDINGDGMVDLVGKAGSGGNAAYLIYLLGNAQPNHFAGTLSLLAVVSPGQFHGILADINGDGRMDAIGRMPGPLGQSGFPTFDILAFLGDPAVPFAATLLSVTGLVLMAQVGVADFDGDGALDYLASTFSPYGNLGGLAFCRGDGQGHFGPPMMLPPGTPSIGTGILVTADVDGDGGRDLVYPGESTTTVLFNQSKIGTGVPGSGGIVPQISSGVATPGNAIYHVAVTGAASNTPTVLGVSYALLPGPAPSGVLLDQTMLILPTPQFGTFQTDANGQATWWSGLPSGPTLHGQTVYLQWVALDTGAATGYSLTPARKVVFW
jgi:FG-GAP-like repeat